MNITPIGKKDYYMKENLKDESTKDYYLKDENDLESIGYASGLLAERLKVDVNKPITKSQYNRILGGYDPSNGEKLLKNAGDKNQKFGYDLTFSAPKDFSIAFALADDKHKEELLNVFNQAVDKATDKATEFLQYRDQKGGKVKYEKAQGALFLGFNHFSSRENDPQIHKHKLLANVVLGKNGEYYAVETKQLYQNHKAVEAEFQKSLGEGLEKLNYQLERGKAFNMNIVGMREDVRRHFSKRSGQIEKYQKQHKEASVQDSKLNTRAKKSELSATENFNNWKSELSTSFNLDALDLEKLKQLPKAQKPVLTPLELIKLTCEYKKNATFTSKDINNSIEMAGSFYQVNKDELRKGVFTDKSVEKTQSKDNGNQIYLNKNFVGPKYLKEHEKNKKVLSKVNLNISKAKLSNVSNQVRQATSKLNEANKNIKQKDDDKKGKPPQSPQVKIGSSVAELVVSVGSITSALSDLSSALLEAKGDQFFELLAQITALKGQLMQAMDRLQIEEEKELKERMEGLSK